MSRVVVVRPSWSRAADLFATWDSAVSWAGALLPSWSRAVLVLDSLLLVFGGDDFSVAISEEEVSP